MTQDIVQVKRRHEGELLAIKGVVGVGVDGGKILVYVESRGVEPEIPASIEGFPTQVVVTGN
ncbi:MAG: hypothetical protein ACXQTF_02910, partial [Candidatus Hecatellaceae archaeon]